MFSSRTIRVSDITVSVHLIGVSYLFDFLEITATSARTAITRLRQIKSKSSVFAFPSVIRGKYLPRAIVVVFRKFLASSPSAPGQFIRQSFHLGSVRCPCCQEQRSDAG